MLFDPITISLLLAAAVRLSAPMLLASLGELVSERAGVLNIGLEGLMLFGAFGAVLGLQESNDPLIGLLSGALWGLGAAAILALAVALLRADQIVIGIGFNILALGATSLLRQVALNPSYNAPSLRAVSLYRIPVLYHWPIVGRAFFMQSPVFYGAVLLAILLGLMLKYTRLGLIIRAVGEGAGAADAAGVSVTVVRFGAMAFTGLCAGLGGGYLTIVASGGVFVDNMTAGRGYLAVAVVIFSRWRPIWILAASILFGCADALQYQGQAIGLSIPPPLLLMSPFVLALVAWVLMGKGKTGPGEIGLPFLRGQK
ncbi:ABC transporter permease [Acidisoma cellulosilytica]|uniref:ABC transporter permease n=1 Tax=Acidisoma cellulosilyticum TaxID=2802395 RepID=A0A964E2N6_9PROT|nr:ABC transporter permease [Acidisoma cellulosilyticum]MCB8879509.1 ABC transporter permease [Acidisoma cellulosilyticum]